MTANNIENEGQLAGRANCPSLPTANCVPMNEIVDRSAVVISIVANDLPKMIDPATTNNLYCTYIGNTYLTMFGSKYLASRK